ncbi:hypothetical protein BKA83DRAFT_4487908 [Pisolithus microcarpus]|nr:hypothetical protein BKA83DRAFT_4487908 [Pisolithus microcarpus]
MDLKPPSYDWNKALEEFLVQALECIHNIVSSIEYFHHCERAAQENRLDNEYGYMTLAEDAEAIGTDQESGPTLVRDHIIVSEDVIANFMASQTPAQEELHGLSAMECANYVNVFGDHKTCIPEHEPNQNFHVACQTDMENLQLWQAKMEKAVHIQNVQDNTPQFTSLEPDVVELANRGLYSEQASVQYNMEDIKSSEVALTSVNPSMLNTDQMCVYDIITWHLQETLSGHNPLPLQMLIHREGGTGKSKVIQTVTNYFDMKGAWQQRI